jgi:protease-4
VHSVTLCEQLEALRKDTATKAVVLRVDSPGGSATASDSIHREVIKLREAGKVVVVSMGNVCASGGYFISCAADKIVAQPGTLTGSIGVIMLKLNAAGFFEDLGINIQTIKAHPPYSFLTRTHS